MAKRLCVYQLNRVFDTAGDFGFIHAKVTQAKRDIAVDIGIEDLLVRVLKNGRHLVLKGQGHGTFAVGCMPKLLGRFLETADAKGLDAKCLDSLDYVPPFTSFNGWEP